MTTSNDLTPEVLEELRKVLDPGAIEWLSLAYGDAEAETVRTHLPALLAAAQRVQDLEAERDLAQLAARLGNETNDELRAKVAELEESDRLYRAELAAIDAALGPVEDTRQAQVRGLVEDRARLDWLERASWTDPRVGNGIVVFPGFRGGVRVIDLHGLGDEDGSNIGDQLANTGDTLREAIDAARQAGKEEG